MCSGCIIWPMNPTNSSAPSSPEMQLPSPVVESLPMSGTKPEASFPLPEVVPAAAESAPKPTSSVASAMPLPALFGTNPVNTQKQGNDVTLTTNIVAPLTADDNDLIEKEWVNKAKQIVERTKHDPSQQSNEINVFKADYLQKRYNKTIKLSE